MAPPPQQNPPIKNEPDNTYSGIDEFRRSVLHDDSAPDVAAEDDKGRFKFLKKSKENPMVPIGIFGAIGALLFSAYKFKSRDRRTPLSVYVIHTRMAAQGAVVSALTLSVLYSMYQEFVVKKELPVPVPVSVPALHPHHK